MRVMKYLRGHIPSVVVIVLLLVAQSFCELSLPAYTSRIVDTGIQGGGIESATPLVLTDKTMDGVRLFLSDEDAQTVSDAYTYDNGIWTLGDTARQPELEPVFIRPLVMYARLSEQGANTVLALRRQMQGGLITREEILARGEEALSGMGVLTDSVLRSAAMQFLKTEYAVAGLNVNHMRTSYLLRTGGRMLLLTLGMIAAAVLCSYVGAKMSAAIGRDLRAQVFRKVLSFSSAEMDKFSTASLITRSTNDVTQIQAVCVMLVRIVLYAPIIGLGGVVMVARTKTGLGWVIALAVAAMLLLVRPISGSGALAAASDIIHTYGADSRIGRSAAVMLGSTETTFYVLAVYFGACGIRHSRWAIPAAIVADVTGFVTAAALVRCLWGT